ncbi:MAG: histidine kinase [Oscillospiraceae bacterium]
MLQEILQYKIFRQKLFRMIGVTFLITLLLCVCTCLVFLNVWATNAQAEAANAFEATESGLRSTAEMVDLFTSRLYRNQRLLTDLANLINSKSNREYLKRRENTSKATWQTISSFPSEAMSYLGGYQSFVYEISIHTTNNTNVLTFDKNTGEISHHFSVLNGEMQGQAEAEHPLIISHNFQYIGTDGYSHTGELRFWLDSKRIFRQISSYDLGAAVVVFPGGSILPIKEMNTGWNNREFLSRIVAAESPQGVLVSAPFTRCHYSKFSYSEFPYTFISVVDDQGLLWTNRGLLSAIILAFLAVSATATVLIVFNLRYDARFLGYILQVIHHVKRGDFSQPEPPTPELYRANEYGLISGELTVMSRELERYIQTEYQLKLKQQEAEMAALQYQINPHFLYNTLEEIRAQAIMKDDMETASTIATLGSLYRDVVYKPSVITFLEEFTLLEQYFKIMHLRYPKSFCYQMELAPEARNVKTVKFWMQPLAENFFTHGFDLKSEYNTLIVSAICWEGGYLVAISDNGATLTPARLKLVNASLQTEQESPTRRIGLPNVYARLRFFYGEKFWMKVSNNEPTGVKVSLYIPPKEVE